MAKTLSVALVEEAAGLQGWFGALIMPHAGWAEPLLPPTFPSKLNCPFLTLVFQEAVSARL